MAAVVVPITAVKKESALSTMLCTVEATSTTSPDKPLCLRLGKRRLLQPTPSASTPETPLKQRPALTCVISIKDAKPSSRNRLSKECEPIKESREVLANATLSIDQIGCRWDKWDELTCNQVTRAARFSNARRKKSESRRAHKFTRYTVDTNTLHRPIPPSALLNIVAELTAETSLKLAARADREAAQQGRSCKLEDDWESLRNRFLRRYQDEIYSELGDSVSLSHPPVSALIKHRFVSHCRHLKVSVPGLGYHGTLAHNFSPIFERGFLIPGNKNSLRSQNGMTHGTGVYISNPGAAWLSKTFCNGPDLLIVATVDPHPAKDRAEAAAQPERYIGLYPRKVYRENRYLREVGDATVFFQNEFVVPIAVAHGAGRPDLSGAPDVRPTPHRGATPCHVRRTLQSRSVSSHVYHPPITTQIMSTATEMLHDSTPWASPNKADYVWVGRRQTQVGEDIVFLPPEREIAKHDRRTKRILVKKNRSRVREQDRSLKSQNLHCW